MLNNLLNIIDKYCLLLRVHYVIIYPLPKENALLFCNKDNVISLFFFFFYFKVKLRLGHCLLVYS